MTIKALIEAGKKATEGRWYAEDTEIKCDADTEVFSIADTNTVGKVDREQPWYLAMLDDAEFIAAARNALPEIEELVEWAREVIRERGGGALVNHFGSCQAPSEPCTCGTDRIREITSE